MSIEICVPVKQSRMQSEMIEKEAARYSKKKRKWKGIEDKGDRGTKRAKKPTNREKQGTVVSVDQLAWKKISLVNDEFEDFEEIEGVDVEYIDKDGGNVVQFKVRSRLVEMDLHTGR